MVELVFKALTFTFFGDLEAAVLLRQCIISLYQPLDDLILFTQAFLEVLAFEVKFLAAQIYFLLEGKQDFFKF